MPIAYDADVATLTAHLEALESVGTVLIVPGNASTYAACNGTANITFTVELGDLPLLIIDAINLRGDFLSVSINEAVRGTKRLEECANKGLCDHTSGQCHCFDWYHSSNADGDFGLRQDCGYAGALEFWALDT